MQLKNFTTLCLALLAFIGLTATAFGQTVLLSEDFDGGIPSDWTSEVVSGSGGDFESWIWTDAGPSGAYAGAVGPITSTTAANGWIIFDSDADCSQNTQDAWLISPAFDASAESNVWVFFDTWHVSFNDRPQVRVGTDLNDIENWASFEVFPGIMANESAAMNPTRSEINISDAAAGESSVYIAFQFLSDASTANGGNLTGCGYAWQVDDVEVNNFDPRVDFDGQVNDFYAIAPNFVTPGSQVEPIGFLADVENVGKEEVDMTLEMSISNGTGIVYTNTLAYPGIASDSLAENQPFDGLFTPATVPTFYTATYTLTTEPGDEIDDNNTQSFNFLISDTLFAKTNQATVAFTPADDNSVSFGNIYYVPNGDGYFARYTSFAVNNPGDLVDKTVTVKLLLWNGEGADNEASADEYGGQPVGGIALNTYTFTGEETGLITIPISFEGEGIALEDDAFYIMTMEYEDTDDTALQLLADDNFDYNAMYLLGDSLMMNRYASCADVGLTGDFNLRGFGPDQPSIITMSIGTSPDLGTTASSEPALPVGSVKVFPNPTDEQFTLQLSLEEAAKNVDIYIYDQLGRVLKTENVENIAQANLSFVTKDLANGQYYVRVRTEQGVSTVPFVVSH